jgi:hydroxymethylbilane synthase
MKPLRIGTRKSELAMWQAKTVQQQLEKQGHKTLLVPIASEGDLNLTQPLYAMGIEGVFTKALDAALLNNQIDLAVHSLKDVPTQMAEGICQAAVLPRENPSDVVVLHPHFKNWGSSPKIGTGSLRRKAQWLRKFPSHTVENLRGNLQKRIENLNQSQWGGALFAAAGLKRLGWNLQFQTLDWMIPAPGQGAITVCCRNNEETLKITLELLNCPQTAMCTTLERHFLQLLEGGCTAPIGALATVQKNTILFKAGLFSLDGQQAIAVENKFEGNATLEYAQRAAEQIINQGGDQLLDAIKKSLK